MTTPASQPVMMPQEVDAITAAFPASVIHLMPAASEIPGEFDNWSNEWNKLASRWFMKGLPASTEFDLIEGIDGRAMLRHLRAVLGSFEPKHEHKIAAVAYLLSQWCCSVKIDGSLVAGGA